MNQTHAEQARFQGRKSAALFAGTCALFSALFGIELFQEEPLTIVVYLAGVAGVLFSVFLFSGRFVGERVIAQRKFSLLWAWIQACCDFIFGYVSMGLAGLAVWDMSPLTIEGVGTYLAFGLMALFYGQIFIMPVSVIHSLYLSRLRMPPAGDK